MGNVSYQFHPCRQSPQDRWLRPERCCTRVRSPLVCMGRAQCRSRRRRYNASRPSRPPRSRARTCHQATPQVHQHPHLMALKRRSTYPLDDVGRPDIAASAPRADGRQRVLASERPRLKVGRVCDRDMLPATIGGERVPCPIITLHEGRIREVAGNDRACNASLLQGCPSHER